MSNLLCVAAVKHIAINYIESLLKYWEQLDSHWHVCWSELVCLLQVTQIEPHVVGFVDGIFPDKSNTIIVHIKTMPESIYSVPVNLDGTFRPASAKCLPRQWNLLRLVAMPLGHLGHVPPHMNLVKKLEPVFSIFTIVVGGFGYIKRLHVFTVHVIFWETLFT